MQILLYVVRGFFFFFPLRGWEQDNFVGKIFEDFSLLFFFPYIFFCFIFGIPAASILFSQQRTLSVPFPIFPEIIPRSRALHVLARIYAN